MSESNQGSEQAFLHDSLETWKRLEGMFPESEWYPSPDNNFELLARHEPSTGVMWTFVREHADGMLLEVGETRYEQGDEVASINYSLQSDGIHEDYIDWQVFRDLIDASRDELLEGLDPASLSREQMLIITDRAIANSEGTIREAYGLDKQFTTRQAEPDKQRILTERLEASLPGPLPEID